MKKLKQFIDWFNGKKRSIGIIGLSFCELNIASKIIAPDWMEVLKWLFIAIGGVGIMHADLKGEKSVIKYVGNKTANTMKKVKTFFWI